MKKFFASLALVAAISFSASAFADTLALWTFETSVPTTAGPHLAEVGVGSASVTTPGGASAGVISNPAGNGSPESFSSNGWDVGEYFQFTTSTLGFDTITLGWAQVSSNTGPKNFKVAVSTNGVTFADVTSYVVLPNLSPPGFWSTSTPHPEYDYAIALPASLDNQALITVRLINTDTEAANSFDPVAATGTSRVDNVLISGTLIPEPASLALLGLGTVTMLVRRRQS